MFCTSQTWWPFNFHYFSLRNNPTMRIFVFISIHIHIVTIKKWGYLFDFHSFSYRNHQKMRIFVRFSFIFTSQPSKNEDICSIFIHFHIATIEKSWYLFRLAFFFILVTLAWKTKQPFLLSWYFTLLPFQFIYLSPLEIHVVLDSGIPL